ncbi:hypothetical protein SAMN05216203_2993 [Marinobacter daqiaonensis]|uniref:Uncharacterized protein n=1 Tax=Marinobacter daqiaonensis TaxID=650891 RepID=A0A1I6JGC4_9GAMM|nr:hypothetical protein [Marinobacter daqiaonensis]SFR77998.1 hypothetical protein SAMN05216203_2993 [Marinobacter daqiaonensis]
MFRSQVLLAAATAVLITGCASSPGDDLPPHGASLRHTMAAQVYRPGDETPPLNGDRAASIMELYRDRGAAPPVMTDAIPGN